MFSQSVSVSNDFAPSRWLLRWATSARIETGFVCISISMCMCVVFCVCMRLFIGVNSFRCGKCIWVLVGCSFVRSFIRYHHHALYCTCTYVCVADRTKWRRTHLEGDGNETCCFWIRWVVTNQLNTSWVITAFEQADILLNIKCGESKHTCMRERERESDDAGIQFALCPIMARICFLAQRHDQPSDNRSDLFRWLAGVYIDSCKLWIDVNLMVPMLGKWNDYVCKIDR